MANGGWYGTQAEWDAAEHPLPLLDSTFEAFAEANGFEFSKNHKDWPERSLKAHLPLASLIQVFRIDLNVDAWKVWVVCYEDRDGDRFWKEALLAGSITGSRLSVRLKGLLDEGLGRLVEWNARPQDLGFVTKLGRIP